MTISHSSKPYQYFPETITDAKSAKQWIQARKVGNWYKDDWARWFAFLKTIGVYYDKDSREYKDKG